MSMNRPRRRKHRRISHSVEQFLDLEAGVDDDDGSEEETNPDDELFIIQDGTQGAGEDHGNHSRLYMRLLHEAENGEREIQGGRSAYGTIGMTDATENVINLTSGQTVESAGIWEMHCQFGREQVAVDHIKAILPGKPPDLPAHTCVVAVDWTRRLRGRIFIEIAGGLDLSRQVQYLMRSLDALVEPRFHQKRFFPFHGLASWIEKGKDGLSARSPHSFARIREPVHYRGDIGYIFSKDEVLWLALVPRVSLNANFKGRRPRQATITERQIQLSNLTDKHVDMHPALGYFVFQGQHFTLEGYLLLPCDEATFFPELSPCPTLEELILFDKLCQLPSEIRHHYRSGAYHKHMAVHDHVWLKNGQHHGQIAIIQETRGLEADVYIPSQDIVISILLESLRRHFEIGDFVIAPHGKFMGLTGYVVRIEPGLITVASLARDTEFQTSPEHIVFFDPPPAANTGARFEIGDEVIVCAGPDKGLQGVVNAVHESDIVIREGEFFPPTFEVPLKYLCRLDPANWKGLQVGDEVKVIADDFIGRAGAIASFALVEYALIEVLSDTLNLENTIKDDNSAEPREFEVPLTSTERLNLNLGVPDNKACIGDSIKVTAGKYAGQNGFVSAVIDMPCALVKEGPLHPAIVVVHPTHVVHTATPKRNDLLLFMDEQAPNPYSSLMGQPCTVSVGPLKGYRAWVIDTHPSGVITVRYEARLQQPEKFAWQDLAFHEEHPELEPVCPASPTRHVRESTPPWDNVSDGPLPPAWDPAAPMPSVPIPPPEPYGLQPPTWIFDPIFHQYRIHLRDNAGSGYEGEFVGISGDKILFRTSHMRSIKVSPLAPAFLRHVVPKVPMDFVVPIEGEYRGRVMRVRELGEEECTLSEYRVTRRSKKYVPPVVKTLSLARIAPPS